MKGSSCTGLDIIPVSVAQFPPLVKGGSGGVVPAEPGPGTRFRGGWTRRGHPPKGRVRRFGRRCWLCPVHPPNSSFARGGKGIARSRRHSIGATKTRV